MASQSHKNQRPNVAHLRTGTGKHVMYYRTSSGPRNFVPGEFDRDLELRWPSGLGVEIGTLKANTQELWNAVAAPGSHGPKGFVMHSVTDDGVDGIVILELTQSPISFVPDETNRSNLLSVVADSEYDPTKIFTALSRILPEKFELRLNPN